MATYKGLYSLPYENGTALFPLYDISEDNSIVIMPGDIIEGSLFVEYTPQGAWNNSLPINFDSRIQLRAVGQPNVGSYLYVDGARSVVFGDLSTAQGFSIIFLCVNNGVYSVAGLTIYASNTPRSYEYETANPVVGVPGYYILTQHTAYSSMLYPRRISDAYLQQFIADNIKEYKKSTDPFSPGGESDAGGGEGNFDGTSVDIDFTSLPTLSAVDTGFISLYNPSLSQLQSLANYMWSDLFDLDTFKKLFGDPMQAILGLSIVPGPIPSGGTQTVKVGNISTGVSMTKAASQYVDVDCGTLNVEEFWGAYLDYDPYTKAEIYLPYIGTHQIAVDDIMGKAVHIKYHIDVLSGACAAEIKCGGSVLYTFIGSVAVSIPITGNDWTNVINGVLSVAGAIGSMVATGGATAPAAAGEIASAAVNSLKPSVEKSGSVSGGGGLMAGKVPVLILTRPRQALPASQNSFTGYPAFITRSLGAVSGYTEVHKIRLGGISATDAELDEIKNLLKGGVIL